MPAKFKSKIEKKKHTYKKIKPNSYQQNRITLTHKIMDKNLQAPFSFITEVTLLKLSKRYRNFQNLSNLV